MAANTINTWLAQVNYSYIIDFRRKCITSLYKVDSSLHLCFGSSFDEYLIIDRDRFFNIPEKGDPKFQKFLFYYHSYYYSEKAYKSILLSWELMSSLRKTDRITYSEILESIQDVCLCARRRSHLMIDCITNGIENDNEHFIQDYLLDSDRIVRSKVRSDIERLNKFIIGLKTTGPQNI